MADISTITSQVTSVSAIVVVSPQATVGYQPQATPPLVQPPALLFHYEGENTATLKSDITDHYIEDNSAIQDNIALKPVMITTHGFIGELNNVVPKVLIPLQVLSQKLTTIGAYVPALSTTALIAYNKAVFAYEIANQTLNAAAQTVGAIANLLSGANGQTVIGNNTIVSQGTLQNQQQTYFQQFFQYWSSRTLFTIQTPWAVFQDMAIDTLRAIQDAETNVISDFEVTFKQMRFASTLVAVVDLTQLQGRLQNQAATGVNLGTTSPPPLTALPAEATSVGVQ